MKKPSEFFEVIKNGVRVSNKYMIVHYKTDKRNVATPLVGFVVPKKQIQKAVDRNKIKRQLRHIIAGKIGVIEPNAQIVIRVLEGCKGQKYSLLQKKLEMTLKKAKEKMENRVEKDNNFDTDKNN